MYILRQEPGDTMILDSTEGHGETSRKLRQFLASTADVVEIVAAGRSPLDPDMAPLRAFRMRKTNGLLNTQELPDGTIEVGGRPDLLARYIAAFEFEPGTENGHHHPEQCCMGHLEHRSVQIIIEADDEIGFPAQHAALTLAGPQSASARSIGLQAGRTAGSFIRATGQSWKMAAGLTLFALAVVAALVYDFGPAQTRSPARSAEAVAGILACAIVWWIRCPGCRRSLGLWSFKHPVEQFGPGDLPSVQQCPYCSFPRTGEPSSSIAAPAPRP